jgi:hypothetical protein
MVYMVLGYVVASLGFVLPYVVRYYRIKRLENLEAAGRPQY